MMVIENEFSHGDFVYLKTDKEQYVRMVTCILHYKSGELMYRIRCGTIDSEHFGYELSKEVNVLLHTTN